VEDKIKLDFYLKLCYDLSGVKSISINYLQAAQLSSWLPPPGLELNTAGKLFGSNYSMAGGEPTLFLS
jgi:hypothetical protein